MMSALGSRHARRDACVCSTHAWMRARSIDDAWYRRYVLVHVRRACACMHCGRRMMRSACSIQCTISLSTSHTQRHLRTMCAGAGAGCGSKRMRATTCRWYRVRASSVWASARAHRDGPACTYLRRAEGARARIMLRVVMQAHARASAGRLCRWWSFLNRCMCA